MHLNYNYNTNLGKSYLMYLYVYMCVCTYRIATVRASVTQYVKGTTLHLCNGNQREAITRSGTYVHTCCNAFAQLDMMYLIKVELRINCT